jgi:hypothetical protein
MVSNNPVTSFWGIRRMAVLLWRDHLHQTNGLIVPTHADAGNTGA